MVSLSYTIDRLKVRLVSLSEIKLKRQKALKHFRLVFIRRRGNTKVCLFPYETRQALPKVFYDLPFVEKGFPQPKRPPTHKIVIRYVKFKMLARKKNFASITCSARVG